MCRRWILGPALASCAVAAALFASSLLGDRDLVASTPSPRALFDVTFVELAPGAALCLSSVTIPPDARRLRLQVRTYGRPGPELAVALRAPGYEQRVTVAGGYGDTALLAPALEPPARAVLGEVCIEQRGRERIALVGTAENRTQSRPEGRIAGTPVNADTYLAFYEGRSASPLSQLGAIVERMSAFRPGIVGPWLLWPLLVLTAIGVPAGVAWALSLGGGRQGRC